MEPPSPVANVVGEDELSEVVRRGEVGPPPVDLSELLDKISELGIGGQHEGGDDDLLPPAEVDLFQRPVDDLHVQAKGVLVDLSALGDGGGLAVGDQEDLLVGLLLARQQVARQLQGLAGVGVVGADLSAGMIERARANAAAEKVDARFEVAGDGKVLWRT